MNEPLGSLRTALADRYRMERELGAGGMATVHLAHDLKHGRDVAIKVLHPDLGAALGGERFLSEIRTTARLQHPHILPLLDSGEAGGQLYYVMPLVTGETLRARLEREKQLPVDDALLIAREVADALAYAHGLGIIHRDIKPENILLQNGHAVVADFGIALAVQSAGGQRMTQTGLSLGTPQYMSPEQAMGERTIDARSDIYALGAVTYEMLVGEPPFTGPSVQAIVARVMNEEPRGLTKQRKAIAPHVENAVLRALEKLPADRFGTATEFAAALAESSTGATRSSRAMPVSRRTPRGSLIASGIAAAAMVAALWGWFRKIPTASVVRYAITLDSVPAARDWAGEVAISPDGSLIVHSGGEGSTLLGRRRNALQFSPIPGTEGAAGPFFSPDGASIGYFSAGRLQATPTAGGPPIVLDDSVTSPEAMSWGSDGYIYRFIRHTGLFALARMEARPDAPLERVTTVDTAAGETSHLLPELLPDKKSLLFQVAFRDGRRAIAVADVKTGRHRILMPGVRVRYVSNGHLLYTTPDGKLWVVPFNVSALTLSGTASPVADRIPSTMVGPVDFAVSNDGTLVYAVGDASTQRELVWVSRTGVRTPFDSTWRGEFASPALSPDGRRLAVAIRRGTDADIWVKGATSGAPIRLSQQNKSNDAPAWTPDGRFITYISGSSGTAAVGDVWRQPADGSALGTLLLHADRPISEQFWSHADNWLVVRTTTPSLGSGDILAAQPLRGGATQPVIATPNLEYSPTLSPDGRWMAYVSNMSGRLEVYVVPFPNPQQARWPISSAGGSAPRWSPRGDELFYLDLQSRMVAVQVTTAPSFALQGTRTLFNASDFVQISVSRRNYDVTPDGQRFLMVQRANGATNGHVVVVENWLTELTARKAP
ncbi:protein kinase domain-containing protein [Gemmatimonas sp.]|uniref:protein kinase domain-containing protein n=1 Tax=Gemmatimonas sp. TaxID=1962908 RepID=UPI003983668C